MRLNFKLLIVFLFCFVATRAQQTTDNMNKWSIDANIGATNAIKPYAPSYWSNSIGLFHTNLGARYMFNNSFGIKLDVGFDRIKNDEFGDNGKSNEFNSQYIRSSFQLIANMGRFMHFEDFAPRFGLFIHGGAGYSTNKNADGPLFGNWDSPDKDNMVNFIVGLTPQFKLNSKMSINADVAFVNHIYQQRTWDLTQPVTRRGFDGLMANLTVGISYYLGSKQEHADWVPTEYGPTGDLTNEEYENRILALEKKMMDDDNDGIPNYIDEEVDTPEGVEVDSKGRAIIDDDNDGIPNKLDKCPDLPGLWSMDGCPDTDGDGVSDYLDLCPEESGLVVNRGCPEIDDESQRIINESIRNIQFQKDSDKLTESSFEVLDEVRSLLMIHPEYSLLVEGHTCTDGTEEHNESLSEDRAKKVKMYLVAKGIDKERIETKWYGFHRPIASNDTEEGKARNRRTEFKIIFK